ncbi:hypothetical protein GUJ93_ZPchr0008g11755 [Zizania palustris]|uniref:Uncharacterized protein n=1 Tax=Zizania palustris TaxID=103762 RepID=A0A8J5V505_ZIZPA|nr:hypothetical protein GUJ93_ZPchr0008g11755 [Zizania palustris]
MAPTNPCVCVAALSPGVRCGQLLETRLPGQQFGAGPCLSACAYPPGVCCGQLLETQLPGQQLGVGSFFLHVRLRWLSL